MERPKSRRLMFKAVVLGFDPALQAGFLSMASGSNISHQLFNAVGVSIGVVSIHQDERNIVLQLWSLPFEERLQGLTRSFMRGHHIAIIVLRPSDVEDVQIVLERTPVNNLKRIMYVIVGDEPGASRAAEELKKKTEIAMDFGAEPSVISAVIDMANRFAHPSEDEAGPLLARISSSACEPFEAPVAQERFPANSEAEIEKILEIAEALHPDTSEDR